MAPSRNRKRTLEPEPEEAEVLSPESWPEPAARRRRLSPENDEAELSDASNQERNDPQDQMVKKLVRLALACEYNRRPIRRTDISEKVLGSATGAKTFKTVFLAAQHELRMVFGMEMLELPGREKVTLQQKRAAQKSQSQSNKTVTSWVLTSILPQRFRAAPDMLLPPAAPTNMEDSQYTSIYTLLVSLIMLSRGQLPDAKMERYLRRLGIEDNTPIRGYDKTEKLLKRMERDGYIVKIKESAGNGEEDISWVVGPRGKVEVGEKGVEGLVKIVYHFETDEADEKELERRIARSLGTGEGVARNEPSDGQAKKRGRPRRGEEAQDEGLEEGSEEDDDG